MTTKIPMINTTPDPKPFPSNPWLTMKIPISIPTILKRTKYMFPLPFIFLPPFFAQDNHKRLPLIPLGPAKHISILQEIDLYQEV